MKNDHLTYALRNISSTKEEHSLKPKFNETKKKLEWIKNDRKEYEVNYDFM